MPTALVTGASAGLGEEFAQQLSARGYDLVLVARSADRLEELAGRLREHRGVAVEVLPADLADREQLARVAARVADAEHDRPVDLLVNNAGFGLRQGLLGGDLAEQETALDVMVRPVLVLTHAAVNRMAPAGRGAVLNVSSVASWATMGSYSAIKAWVTVFSEGLARELADRGVLVTAVCPGFVHTEFHARARISKQMVPGRMWLTADRVVAEALADLDRGHPVSVPSRRYRAVVRLLRHAPRRLVRRGSAGMSRRRGSGSP
ncbi:SDR family NAD(P)-dependent oxidoreductase [Ornithinicoccus halotolerans]|uniref:SDR family NAD(P)-dependent oxidoreductase n=1 Tax=Ornithinicoccus halotolerans TaxID=1748220 RepID=UPI001296E92E|nr:SDR family oxidoreductase [Ornithinicoccus halotolerans]